AGLGGAVDDLDGVAALGQGEERRDRHGGGPVDPGPFDDDLDGAAVEAGRHRRVVEGHGDSDGRAGARRILRRRRLGADGGDLAGALAPVGQLELDGGPDRQAVGGVGADLGGDDLGGGGGV